MNRSLLQCGLTVLSRSRSRWATDRRRRFEELDGQVGDLETGGVLFRVHGRNEAGAGCYDGQKADCRWVDSGAHGFCDWINDSVRIKVLRNQSEFAMTDPSSDLRSTEGAASRRRFLNQLLGAGTLAASGGTLVAQGDGSDPVVSRNSITTECADFQSVGRGAVRATSHRAPRCRTVRLRQWT